VTFIISGVTISMLLLQSSIFGEELSYLRYTRYLAVLPAIALYPPLLNKLLRIASKIFKREIPKLCISMKNMLYYWIFGILIWIMNGIALGVFVEAFFHISISDFITVIGIYPTGYVAGFLAVIFPAGLGVREGVFTVLLSSILPSPLHISISILSRFWIMTMELIVVIPFFIKYLVSSVITKSSKD